ncbi:hypothetical protein [Perlabentimonas gracilis]|uniref:hypothetical protein n=1 Tax=Perlabentimonas gracilis TaxID=2715279 RepID=UPI00140B679A|nr:hypothetical protein [Perlabentimonas gracilis]NHB70299.1 hypothetical protein [Perlabentimonas gracilis]
MKKIMHILFLSCLKATELMEKKFHFKLSAKEKIQLKMHKMMCEACTKYEKQSALIEKGISKMDYTKNATLDIEMLKSKIAKRLENINEN